MHLPTSRSFLAFHLRLLAAIAVITPSSLDLLAQEAPAGASQASAATPEMEAKFIATLTNATLKGRWNGIKDGELAPEKADTYEVVGATKVGGDRWTINARLSYAGKSLVLPIPAQVKWAGDTPVLVIDNLSLGIGPSYSARVMFFENTYAGSWSGGGQAGLLSGLVTNAAK